MSNLNKLFIENSYISFEKSEVFDTYVAIIEYIIY